MRLHYLWMICVCLVLLGCLGGCTSSVDNITVSAENDNVIGSTEEDALRIETASEDILAVNVEVVRTPQAIMRGLMHREQLDANAGMLFVFGHDQQLTFWMKNTLIPLDMIFVNSSGYIVDIIEADPCTENPCATYPAKKPAQFVLEVNQGYAREKNVKVGDFVHVSDYKA